MPLSLQNFLNPGPNLILSHRSVVFLHNHGVSARFPLNAPKDILGLKLLPVRTLIWLMGSLIPSTIARHFESALVAARVKKVDFGHSSSECPQKHHHCVLQWVTIDFLILHQFSFILNLNVFDFGFDFSLSVNECENETASKPTTTLHYRNNICFKTCGSHLRKTMKSSALCHA